MQLTRQLRRSSQTLLLVIAPHGGQATARRNASAGMSVETASQRSRRPRAVAVAVPEQGTGGRPAPASSTSA